MMVKLSFSFILTFIVCVSFQSCVKKENPFLDTQEGKNTLGFYLDGKKYEYATAGGFPSEYPYSHCVYGSYFTADHKFSLSAELDSQDDLDDFSLTLINDNLKAGKKYMLTEEGSLLEVILTYVHWTPQGNGMSTSEINKIKAKSGYIEFSKFDINSKIASGRFEFEFESESESEKEEPVIKKLTNGMFDASLTIRETDILSNK